MFNDISHNYDFLNRLLSFRRDIRWRKKTIARLKGNGDCRLLDLACGTGDMIIEINKQYPERAVIGADFSTSMLAVAKQKVSVPLVAADACNLPFPDNSFDIVTIAFGFRNVVDKERGLQEMYRVLKPNGTLCILEFSNPKSPIFAAIYKFYFNKVLPFIGGLFSDKAAYSYLPESVANFPAEEKYKKMISDTGFNDVKLFRYDFGICNAAYGRK